MHRHFETDSLTGVRKTFVYDETDDTFAVVPEQQVRPVLEQNKALHRAQDERAPWKGEGQWHRVASIPNIVWVDLLRRGIAQDNRKLMKWLDDPENLYLRTRPGKLSR